MSLITLGLAFAGPFTESAAGREAQALADCLNSGDREKITAFVGRYARYDALVFGPTENQVELLVQVSERSGGIEVSDVKEFPNRAFFTMTAKKSGRKAMAAVFLGDDGKLRDVMFRPMRDPASQKAFALPGKASSKAGLLSGIERYLDGLSKEDAWSGVVLVAKGDRVLLHTAHGYADRAFEVPIRKDTKFDLASTGKLFTDILIGRLIDDRRLSLDDPVAKHLPEFDKTPVADVTVKQLLTHTGGVPDIFESPRYDRMRRYRNARSLATGILGEPLLFEPGKNWSYSNGGFILLGAIAESITGTNYRELCQQWVWRPAGMVGTDAVGRDYIVPNLARNYDRDIFDVFSDESKRNDGIQYGYGPGPHGGGHSTAHDLFKLAKFLNEGRLIRKETLDRFRKPTDKNPNYGYGLELTDAGGHQAFGHNGHARSDVAVVPDLDLYVVVLGNDLSSPAPMIARDIRGFLGRSSEVVEAL